MNYRERVQDYMDELVSYLQQDAQSVGRKAEVEFLEILRKQIRGCVLDALNTDVVARFAEELLEDELQARADEIADMQGVV